MVRKKSFVDKYGMWPYIFVVGMIIVVALIVLFLIPTAPFHQSYIEDNDVRAPVDVHFFFWFFASFVSGLISFVLKYS